MNELLLYIIQVNVLLALIYLGYHFLLRGLTFYRLNRVYLLTASIYALVYPLMDVPSWFRRQTDINMPILWSYLPPELVYQQTDQSVIFTMEHILLIILGIGACVLILRFLIQLLSLLRIHFHSSLSQWGKYFYRNVLYPVVPFSFFNKIYLHKAQHSEPELDDIFEHEHIHVKGLHSIDILLFEILWISCWYNPFVWFMRRSVRHNLEFLTDQQVLNKGIDRQTYQYSLLHVTQQGTAIGIGNQFNFKTLKKRIMMMNKKRSSKMELSKYAFLLPILIVVGASFTVSKTENQVEKVIAIVKETDMAQLISTELTTAERDQEERTAIGLPLSRTTTTLGQDSSIIVSNGVMSLKSRAEIDKTKDYAYQYDKTPISKADFFALADDEVYDILLVEDKQALSALYPKEKDREGVVRARSLADHQKSKENEKLILYIIDGVTGTKDDMAKLDPNEIESISVLKDEAAIDAYGEKGKYGVVLITTKQAKKPAVDTLIKKAIKKSIDLHTPEPAPQSGSKAPLVIVDGKQMSANFDLKSIDANNIESITVLKNKQARTLYGEKGKNGVIMVTGKKASPRVVIDTVHTTVTYSHTWKPVTATTHLGKDVKVRVDSLTTSIHKNIESNINRIWSPPTLTNPAYIVDGILVNGRQYAQIDRNTIKGISAMTKAQAESFYNKKYNLDNHDGVVSITTK